MAQPKNTFQELPIPGRWKAALALFAVVLGSGALAAWAPVPFLDLARSSDLIAVGTIVHVAREEPGLTAVDRGVLQVDEVLAGHRPFGEVVLRYPGRRPPGTPPDAREIRFDLGMEGVWFLQKDRRTGEYTATHPARFKPLLFLPSIRSQLR